MNRRSFFLTLIAYAGWMLGVSPSGVLRWGYYRHTKMEFKAGPNLWKVIDEVYAREQKRVGLSDIVRELPSPQPAS